MPKIRQNSLVPILTLFAVALFTLCSSFLHAATIHYSEQKLPGPSSLDGWGKINNFGALIYSSSHDGVFAVATVHFQGQDYYLSAGPEPTFGRSINDLGQAVGFDFTSGFFKGPFSAYQTVEGPLAGAATLFYDINNSSVVVGADFASPSSVAIVWHPSIDTALDLNSLYPLSGGHLRAATEINSKGEIIGSANIDGLPLRGFFASPTNGLKILAPLSGYEETWIADINDKGQVIGNSGITGSGFSVKPTLWAPDASGAMNPKALALPPQTGTAEAKAINAAGNVAGSAAFFPSSALEAVVWIEGRLVRLGAPGVIVNSSGCTLFGALDINEGGQVLVAAECSGVLTHILLTPVL